MATRTRTPDTPSPKLAQEFTNQTQAAAFFGVTTRTVRNWIADGRLPGYKIGARVMVRIADLEALARPIPAATAGTADAEQVTIRRADLEAAVKHGDPYDSAEIMGRILRDAIVASVKAAGR